MIEHHEDQREPVVQKPGHYLNDTPTREKRPRGF
jgi:hypothetical protein